MEREQLIDLVARLTTIRPDELDRADAAALLTEIGRLRAWTEHLRLGVIARITALSPTPERDISDADGSSGRDASRDITSSQAVGSEALSGPSESMAEGAISRAHLDLLADMLRSLGTPELRDGFRARLPELDAMARITPFDPFARHVRRIVDQLRRDAGEERLTRQRRETRLSIRVDRVSGMIDLHGRFDPRSGLILRNRLDEIRDQLAASGFGDRPDAPTDPLQRPAWLLGHALLQLVDGTAAPARRPDITIVIDTRSAASASSTGMSTGMSAPTPGRHMSGATGAPDPGATSDLLADALRAVTAGHATVDYGLDIDLPIDELATLARTGTVHTTITDGHRIVHTTGRTDLGRTTRLASRDQRRALRAIYPRCAIPDCPTPFERCEIHHVIPWENGGPTDLDNLLPICAHHHTQLHADQWHLHLHPDRTLTISLPDRTTLNATPPAHRAA